MAQQHFLKLCLGASPGAIQHLVVVKVNPLAWKALLGS